MGTVFLLKTGNDKNGVLVFDLQTVSSKCSSEKDYFLKLSYIHLPWYVQINI